MIDSQQQLKSVRRVINQELSVQFVRRKTQRQKKIPTGFSLVELMISMAVGMILVSGVISMFTGSLKHTNEFVSLTKLDQELQGIMDLITKEVRRTGYDGDSNAGSDTDFGVNSSSTATCLLYSYDNDTGGNIGSLDADEQYGIRFTGDKILFGSSVSDCSTGSWNSINDNKTVQITALTFTQNDLCLNLVNNTDCKPGGTAASSGDQLLWRKQIDVSITGNYTNDSNNYARTLTNSVRLHNDVLQTEP